MTSFASSKEKIGLNKLQQVAKGTGFSCFELSRDHSDLHAKEVQQHDGFTIQSVGIVG